MGQNRKMVRKISDIPFMDKAWYQSWFNHLAKPAGWSGPLFGPEVNGCYIPLAWIHRFKLRFACLVGNYGPFRDIGLFNPASLVACVEHLERNGVGTGLRLGPVSDQSAHISALLDVLCQRGWHIVAEQLGDEWIVDWSEQGFDQYWASLSKKKVSRIDYYHRRMQKHGDVKVKHYHDLKTEAWTDILHELVDVESNAWLAEGGEPRFLGAANQAYWQELFKSENVLRALQVWMMYFECRPVSFLFALDGQYTRYLYAQSYHKLVKDHSTGSTLWRMAFFDANERGLDCINLGLGNGGYKTSWGAQPTNRILNYICFPPTLVGSLLSDLFYINTRIEKRGLKLKD